MEAKEVKPEEFIQFVSLAKETYQEYRVTCDVNELDSYLLGFDVNKLETLNIIPVIKAEYNLSTFKTTITQKIEQNSNSIDALYTLYSRLKEFERPVEIILNEDVVYDLLIDSVQNANHKFNDDLICMLMVTLKEFSSNQLSNLEDLLNVVSYDEESIESIAQKIEYYVDYVDFVTNTDSMEYSLYSTIAEKITEKNYCELSDINIKSILNKYDTILSTLSIESNILMEKIGNKKIGSINKENINLVPVKFFEDTINLNNDLVISCKNNANEYLKCKTVDNWEDNIVKKTYDYQLFSILHPNLQNYFDAIKKLLLKYATGEMATLDKETINKALEWAKENEISLLSTFNDIRDAFCHNLKMNTEYFDFYGEWLFEYAKLDEKKEVLRTIFKSDILSQDENIELILKNREKMLKIIENANDEKDDFINKITQLLSEKYSEKLEFIDFARSIGIEHKQEEKKNILSKE